MRINGETQSGSVINTVLGSLDFIPEAAGSSWTVKTGDWHDQAC